MLWPKALGFTQPGKRHSAALDAEYVIIDTALAAKQAGVQALHTSPPAVRQNLSLRTCLEDVPISGFCMYPGLACACGDTTALHRTRREEALRGFKGGALGLQERAAADALFDAACARIVARLRRRAEAAAAGAAAAAPCDLPHQPVQCALCAWPSSVSVMKKGKWAVCPPGDLNVLPSGQLLRGEGLT